MQCIIRIRTGGGPLTSQNARFRYRVVTSQRKEYFYECRRFLYREYADDRAIVVNGAYTLSSQ